MSVRDEIPPGTLHLLILKTLARSGEAHEGAGHGKRVESASLNGRAKAPARV